MTEQTFDGTGQLRDDNIRQWQLFPERQQSVFAKTAVPSDHPQPQVPRQLIPQVEEERHRVAAARRIAPAQPELYYQPHFRQDRE